MCNDYKEMGSDESICLGCFLAELNNIGDVREIGKKIPPSALDSFEKLKYLIHSGK